MMPVQLQGKQCFDLLGVFKSSMKSQIDYTYQGESFSSCSMYDIMMILLSFFLNCYCIR